MRRMIVWVVALLCVSLLSSAQDHEPIIINEQNLQPEGIAWDPDGERFFVGSLSQGTLFTVGFDGTLTEFVAADDFRSTVGIHIADGKLYVPNSTASAFFARAARSPIDLIVYDLETGERLLAVDLTDVYAGEGARFVNDVTADSDGNAYLTDSFQPVIYRVTPEGDAAVWVESELLRADFFGGNGIDVHPDGYLLIANPGTGIVLKAPLDDPEAIAPVDFDKAISIDGMELACDGALYAVARLDVDGDERQVIARLTSDDGWRTMSVSGAVPTEGSATTLATICADDGETVEAVYYVNAYLNNIFRSQYEVVPVHPDLFR